MTDHNVSEVEERRFGPALTTQPVVSVLMITYNHECFIRQAIESVFMQQVDFPIELVIGEDCSTDTTFCEIARICQSAPFSVRVLTRKVNVGMHANFIETLSRCRGSFVALLEGDDYWCDSSKLQRQAQVLKHRPDVALCFHSVQMVHALRGADHAISTQTAPQLPDGDVPLLPVISFSFYLPTASAMIRKSVMVDIPQWHKSLPFLDGLLWIVAAARGKLFFVNHCMAAYRVGNGVSQGIDYATGRDWQVYALAKFALNFPKSVRFEIDKVVTGHWRWRSHALANENQRLRSSVMLLQLLVFRLRLGLFDVRDVKRLLSAIWPGDRIRHKRPGKGAGDA